jgi:hypothetical protein
MLDASRKTDPKAALALAVQSLADEIHQPVETVQVVYERELVALQATARIKDYVALFAGRRTREVLQRGDR